jgi:hypothetical protein
LYLSLHTVFVLQTTVFSIYDANNCTHIHANIIFPLMEGAEAQEPNPPGYVNAFKQDTLKSKLTWRQVNGRIHERFPLALDVVAKCTSNSVTNHGNTYGHQHHHDWVLKSTRDVN